MAQETAVQSFEKLNKIRPAQSWAAKQYCRFSERQTWYIYVSGSPVARSRNRALASLLFFVSTDRTLVRSSPNPTTHALVGLCSTFYVGGCASAPKKTKEVYTRENSTFSFKPTNSVCGYNWSRWARWTKNKGCICHEFDPIIKKPNSWGYLVKLDTRVWKLPGYQTSRFDVDNSAVRWGHPVRGCTGNVDYFALCREICSARSTELRYRSCCSTNV